jgi:hypothetical protein
MSEQEKVTVSYPGGFSESCGSIPEAEARLRESSNTGEIEMDPDEPGRYREHRAFGFNGPGWYFAGRIYHQQPKGNL